ncbi:aminotransferase class III-fold pyridoxal phosphate-dependent enzyme [Roseococcus sp. SDR]|uniref:aspartate aminotransferase family protein n=1 Tax=Roseococcus sp. SDR TaxID=2835532 RepID=UPI001BCDE0C3|nr:aminotransferase class III-fold pyridoxal phosphate-dependent enzyme [Roseococcus sp. SDR]MBS7791348.1 aminotransferase class III-fold pyridoxal phosphate-dependent enzyme [Roseococcus sp. SDR]MBV1846662.1 aminotransferase class III-fold pyridoxal phosphate-dependent enzyme [Roseococcus sp. SDR]
MPPLDHPAPRNSDLEGALLEARATYAAARPQSAALHEAARRVMPGGNTRTVLFWSPFPISMARGEGAKLWDADGHAYTDLLGEYTAGLFGHSERRILDVARAAMDTGINLAGAGANEIRFAELVCARFPSIERVRFTNSGTEANIMALSAARAFTGRAEIMVAKGGYHGGVMTFASGQSPVNLPVPTRFLTYNDVEGSIAAIREAGDKLAAVLVEPMLGSGGCIPATREFLAALRDACTETGAVLIFDEVMTSRHSEGGLQQRHNVIPDMTTLGKYIAGGMNVGAFGGRAAIMDVFDAHRPGALPHAGTFNNNVWSMAAGCVALGELFRGEVVEALFQRGEALRAELNALCAVAGVAMQFTGAGSMMTAHFRAGAIKAPYAATPEEEQARELFFLDMLEAGFYLARRGMVALSLPLAPTDLGGFVAAFREFLNLRGPLLARAA